MIGEPARWHRWAVRGIPSPPPGLRSDPDVCGASLTPVRTSKRSTENEMSRYAIAIFLLLLLGAAVEELAGRSVEPVEGSVDAAVEAPE